MNNRYQYCPWCATSLVLASSTTHELRVGQELKVCPKPNCGFIHWNNPIPVAVTLIARRHKIALVKRKCAPQIGLWCPPCGFVDEFESLPFAAKRESLEESSLNVEVEARPFSVAAPQGVNQIISFFRATRYEGKLEAGDDADDAGWFSVDDCPELAFSTHQDVITKWFKRPQVRAWRVLAKLVALVGISL